MFCSQMDLNTYLRTNECTALGTGPGTQQMLGKAGLSKWVMPIPPIPSGASPGCEQKGKWGQGRGYMGNVDITLSRSSSAHCSSPCTACSFWHSSCRLSCASRQSCSRMSRRMRSEPGAPGRLASCGGGYQGSVLPQPWLRAHPECGVRGHT